MKKRFYTLVMTMFLMGGLIQAQDILYQSFDDVSTIGNWANSTAGTHSVTQSTDAAEGSGSLSLAYNLVGDQGWGSSVDMQMLPAAGNFDDASAMEGFTFWYKVISPATDAVAWNTKIFVNSTGGEEEWHSSLGTVLDDASGEWQQAKIPFTSFAIPGWLTTYDGVFYADQIAKIEMQIVSAEGITSMGEILIDGMGVYQGAGTTAGALLWDFETTGAIGTALNSTGGSFFLNSSTDATQGDAATCLEYFLVADQSWGGSVDLQLPAPNGFYPDLSAEDGIRFDFKATTPASVSAGVQWNVKIFVNSTGGTEEWHGLLGGEVIGDASGEWQEGKLNFSGFAIPSWLTTYDGVLYKDSISRIDMQIVTNSVGLETSGVICLDNLTSYKEDAVFYDGYYLNDFENPSTGGVNGFQNSTAGSHTVYASVNSAAGDSAACVSYNLVGDQGWGGSIDLILTPPNGGYIFQDMTEHLGVTFWYRNNTPTSAPGNVSFNLKTFEQGPNGTEEYVRSVGGVLSDDSGEWKQVYVPFADMTIPSWLPTDDGVLQKDSIYQFVFQILGQEGTTTTGDICFDNFRSYDDEEVTDLVDPPVSVTFIEDVNMKIYPNPASSKLFIEGLNSYDRIEIYSANGSLVKTQTNNFQIDVHDLQIGFYFMKIYSEEDVFSARFMKQ